MVSIKKFSTVLEIFVTLKFEFPKPLLYVHPTLHSKSHSICPIKIIQFLVHLITFLNFLLRIFKSFAAVLNNLSSKKLEKLYFETGCWISEAIGPVISKGKINILILFSRPDLRIMAVKLTAVLDISPQDGTRVFLTIEG